MKKVDSNEHKTKSVIEAYDKWLKAYDSLLKKYDELSKTKKIHDAGIKMNLVLSDTGVYEECFNISLNMFKENQGVVEEGIKLDFYEFSEFSYVASYVIDKYLETTKHKLVIEESDEEFLKLSTDFSDIIIRNFIKYRSFEKTEKLFFNLFNNYRNGISNVGEINFQKQWIRQNKEANVSLLNKVEDADLVSKNDIPFDNMKILKK